MPEYREHLANRAATTLPLTDSELEAAWVWAMRHGPANGWAGSSGATIVLDLLTELERRRKP